MSAPVMKIELMDGRSVRIIEGVTSFVGEDAHGQFGLWPRHEPVLTVLSPGLFRYRQGSEKSPWLFGASLGGLLRSEPEEPGEDVSTQQRLQMVSQRFLLDGSPEQLKAQLDAVLAQESTQRQWARSTVEQMDRALYQRLQELAEGSPR